MVKNSEVSYQAALKELEKILLELNSENVDIDRLAERLKRAYILIDVCRSRIKSAEIEIEKINQKFKK